MAIRAMPKSTGVPTDKDHVFARYSQQYVQQSVCEQRSR